MKKMFIVSIAAAADYVGQEFQPRVILELDTPGVYNTSLVLI